MTDPLFSDEDVAGDARLRTLFQGEVSAPIRDPAFAHAAMQRIAVRRFWFNLLAAVPWLVAASAALWAFGPVLRDLGREAVQRWMASPLLSQGLTHAAMALTPTVAVLLGLAFIAGPRLRRL